VSPAHSDEPAPESVRLSVNLSPLVAADLRGYAGRKEITITEAVRRAVAYLTFFDEIAAGGGTVTVREDGKVRNIEFLV
jgi:hypothetical protein